MCLQNKCGLHDYKPNPTGPQSLGGDYEALLQHADHWNDVIQRAIDERAQCLRKANALGSATRSLPNEILAAIFKFACPSIDFRSRIFCEDPDRNPFDVGWPIRSREKEDLSYRRFPLILGAVSSQWRQVAWSDPGLWTTLAVEPTYKTVKKDAARLGLYMTNAKRLGFALELDLRRYNEEIYFSDERDSPLLARIVAGPDDLSLEPLKSVLFGNTAGNIRTLRIAGAPKEWLLDIGPKLTNVVDLSIGWDYPLPSGSAPVLQGLESLRRVTLVNATTTWQLLFPTNLTVIRLRGVELKNCITLLLSCTSLLEYYVRSPRNHSNPNAISGLFKRPLICPTIKRFGWDDVLGSATFLRMIRLPNLEYLEWAGFPNESEQAVVDFFSNLPPSLSSLALHGDFVTSLRYERLRLRDMLIRLSHVEEITLLKCYRDFAQDIFTLLSQASGSDDPSVPNDFVLPGLRKVRICRIVQYTQDVGIGGDSGTGRVILYPRYFMDTVRRRRKIIGIPDFRLELTKCRLERVKAVWKKFREMVDGGLKLEVVEDGKWVDWSQPI